MMSDDATAPDPSQWLKVHEEPDESLAVYMSRDGLRVLVATPAGLHEADGRGVEALALRYNLPQLLPN